MDGENKIVTVADLPEKRAAFVRALAAGHKIGKAAELAGYTQPGTEGSRLMRDPRVQKALQIERGRIIQGPVATLALNRLEEALEKGAMSKKDQFPYIKLALSLAGHTEKAKETGGINDKPMTDWTQDELRAFVSQAHDKLADMARPAVIDADGVEPDPED